MGSWRRWGLGLAVGGAALGALLAWYHGTEGRRGEDQLRTGREALARHDRHEAERRAGLLDQAGYHDHARLLQGEIALAEGRALQMQLLLLAQAERSLTNLGALGLGLAGPLAGAWPALLTPNLPTAAPADREERARACLRLAYRTFADVAVGSPLEAQAGAAMGECLARLRDLGAVVPVGEAVQRLEEVAAREPDQERVHRWLASFYLDLNAYPQAIQHLEALARLAPRDGRPHRMMGLLYKDFRKAEQAIQAYRAALARDLEPHTRQEVIEELAALLNDYGQPALAVLDQVAPEHRGDAAVLALRAEALRIQGDPAGAAALTDQALARDPDQGRALRLKAALLRAQGRAQEALPYLERALRTDSQDHESRHQLIEVFQLLGDAKRAQDLLRERDRVSRIKDQITHLSGRAVVDPNNDQARYEVAMLWLALGRPAEARTWLRAALAANPRHAAARQALDRLEGRAPVTAPGS